MAVVRKFTIGIQPFAKMFRVHSYGGAAVDAILKLRGKQLPEKFFSEVRVNHERTSFQINSEDQLNSLQLTEETFTVTRDFYEGNKSFDFSKFLDEFRPIWTALNGVIGVFDIRRIGMVAEYRLNTDQASASDWLRTKLTTLPLPSKRSTAKFSLRFEERELATDGRPLDVKTADFINYIYHYYDGVIDANHPMDGAIDADLDIQKYYSPLHNGNVPDEILKLYKHFDPAQKRLDEQLKNLGAVHGKR